MVIRKLFILFLLLFGIYDSVHGESQLSVVQRVRKAHPDLPGNRPVTNQALIEIAADPSVKAGTYVKTTGNNCLGYSCDIICYKDGRLYDVFYSWENLATATWNLKPGAGDPSRCVLQGTTEEPPTTCVTCENALIASRIQNRQLINENEELKKQKAEIAVENKRLYDQLQEWDARLNKCLVDYNTLLNKYNNVTCTGILGTNRFCSVVKP